MTTNPTTQPHDYDPKILADPEYNRSYHAYLTTNPPEEAARLAYTWTVQQTAHRKKQDRVIAAIVVGFVVVVAGLAGIGLATPDDPAPTASAGQ